MVAPPVHVPPPPPSPPPSARPAWWDPAEATPLEDAPPAPEAKAATEGSGFALRRLDAADVAGLFRVPVEAAASEPAVSIPHEGLEADAADMASDETAALTPTEAAAGPTAPPVVPAVPRAPPKTEAVTPRPDGGPLIQALRHALATSSPDQRPVELSFAAPELGPVRLVMRGRGRAVSVAIEAERGDTLALMQTHVDSLVRDLNELGYTEATVSFSITGADAGAGQGDRTDAPLTSPQDRTGRPGTAQHADPALHPDLALQPGPERGWRDGLDLRL